MDPRQKYLRLTIQKNYTVVNNSFNFDALGSCFINRIDVFSGSNFLETVESYNFLLNTIVD